jgi:GTP-binding protein
MSLPQVVIVGRPNVGKSSLFNWLAGKRLAIVDPTAGVTRDRLTHLLHERERFFEIVDTGGMGIKDIDNLTEHIEQQIETAIDLAELVLFVVDAREGVAPLDLQVAERLRRVERPVVLVANKADDAKFDAQSAEFFKLGFGEPITVSTLQNRNRDLLLDAIVARLSAASAEAPPSEPVMKLAIVGRRNTGKSTFVNTLAQAERVIVSEIAGTTRDSIDVRYELDGKPFIAIDTPGLRRTKSIQTDIDFYGMHRAQRSIRRSDVVLLFFDAMQPISKVDKQLAEYIFEQHKPCVFVVNKWDLVSADVPTGDWAQYLRDTFRTLQYAPIAFITALTGKNVKTLCNHAQMLFKQARERVGTSDINNAVHDVLDANPPPMHHQGRPKVFYATQVDVEPPTIVLFCNNPKAFSASYRRYLLTALRDRLPFAEVPIRLYLRRREQTAGEQKSEHASQRHKD